MAEAVAVPDNVPSSWAVWSTAALIAIVTAPPCLCIWFWHAGWQSLAGGALLWAIAVALKRPFSSRFGRVARSWSIAIRAIIQGALSAASELGAAAVYFLYVVSPSFAQVT